MTSPRAAVSAVMIASALTLAGCGGGSSGGTPSSSTTTPATTTTTPSSTTPSSPAANAPADAAAATKQIKAAYKNFFSAGNSFGKAEANLEDGTTLVKTLKFAKKTAAGAKEAAKVSTVTFTSGTTASVKYTLFTNGNPALKNADGLAVQQNGTWKVAKATFCGLLGLASGGKPVPGCTP